MNHAKRLLIGALLAASLAVTACAFEKTNTYTPGQFTDVPQTEWYAAEVANTYELGLMNGVGGGLFSPDGNVTVAEAITMAARASAINAGTAIDTSTGGEWYTPYVNYAVAAGFVKEGQFDNFDRPAKRFEVASIFKSAMPADYFTAKNEVKSIPDVSENSTYAADLLTLYKAGVVMGSDSYGNFFPENNITRAEAAAIINRVALPDNRLSKTLDSVSEDDAYLLVTSRSPSLGNSQHGLKSGWLYDGRGGAPLTSLESSYSSLVDISTENGTAYIRELNKTTTGKVLLRTSVSLGKKNYEGAYIEYQNETGDSVYQLKVLDGAWQLLNADGSYTKLVDLGENRAFYFYIVLDLDNNRAETVIGDTSYGVHPLATSGEKTNLVNFRFATDEKSTAILTPGFIKMTVNYGVYENFDVMSATKNILPYGWTTLGGAYSASSALKLPGNSSAMTQFDPVSGKIIAEFIAWQPGGESFTYDLRSGAKTIAAVSADANNYYVNGTKVYDNYVKNLWYRFRLELDTETQKMLVKVNGRKVGEVDFADSTTSVDNFVVSNLSDTEISMDTFKVYRYVEHEDYVPAPVKPAGEDKYTVGMNVCSLWVNELHAGWGTVSAHDDLTQVLGYYDEGNPETADWEIKYLVEHGIDFGAYCIYFGTNNMHDGVINIDSERNHLFNGFMNAKYSEMSKYAVLWEAGNASSPTNFEAFKNNYVPFFIENFFKDDRYMTIGNKPVLCVFGWRDMAKRAGGEENVKKMFDYLEEEVKKLGFDGMIYLACDSSNNTMMNMGFDGSYAYNWGTSGSSLSYTKDAILNSAKFTGMYTVPTISVGFNNVAWSGSETRHPMMSFADYAAAQKWVKEEYLPTYAKENWQKNFVMLSTWNEYGEGTYLMPTAGENGFGYLDALREAYTDEKADKAVNTVPTAAQKTRINRMYPQYRHLLRRDGVVNEMADTSKLSAVASLEFTSKEGFGVANIENIEFTPNGAFGTSKGDALIDKTISCNYTLDKVPAIRITMQAKKGEIAQLFFMTTDNLNPAEARSFKFEITSDEMTEYVINASANSNWRGKIAKLRIDPVDGAGKTFGVKSIELLADTTSAPTEMIIDGQKVENFFKPVKSEKGDMLIAFDPRQAIDYRLDIFHVWNKDKGELTINMKKHVILLTVGSDKYTVDGKTKELGYKLPSIDGLPYLPIEKFCADVGYAYAVDEKGRINVETDNKWYYDKLSERKDGEWQFDLTGDTEGWTSGFMGLSVANEGHMSAVSLSDSTDPTIMSAKGINLPAEKYVRLEYRVRYSYSGQYHKDRDTEFLTMYFITNNDQNWSESKTLKVKLKGKSSDGAWEEYAVDTASNALWKDTITQLRFDPFDAIGEIDIDYIRFVVDPNYVDPGEAPFAIRNGDAEGSTVAFSDTHGKIKIVKDPDNSNNRCYVLPCDDIQIWLYAKQSCTFKPGATYKVSMDVRLYGHGTDTALDPSFKGEILANMQYSDPDIGKNDHVIKNIFLTAGDGWKKFEFEFTVNPNSEDRGADMFTIYSNPVNGIGVGYYFDNIVVEEILPD